jgi:hypothetical protein
MTTNHVSKISNILWDKYYAKKQEALAEQLTKVLAKSKVSFDPKVPMIIAKTIIKRKKN